MNERVERKDGREIYCRQLQSSDAEAWYDILHRGYQALRGMGISFDAIEADRETALGWFHSTPCYGLFCEKRLISIVSLRMPWGSLPGPESYPHMGWFTTDPDEKGKGYARALFQWLENAILREQLHAPCVTLGTAKEHPWLVSMYQSMGFVGFAEKQLPGKKHHTLYMRKNLLSD